MSWEAGKLLDMRLLRAACRGKHGGADAPRMSKHERRSQAQGHAVTSLMSLLSRRVPSSSASSFFSSCVVDIQYS
jgi:hypothetical protein